MTDLSAEVLKLEKETKRISKDVDTKATKEERLKDMPTFDSDMIYENLISEATYYENLSNRFFFYEIEAIKDGSQQSAMYWNAVAIENKKAGEGIRKAMTRIISLQKMINRTLRVVNSRLRK